MPWPREKAASLWQTFTTRISEYLKIVKDTVHDTSHRAVQALKAIASGATQLTISAPQYLHSLKQLAVSGSFDSASGDVYESCNPIFLQCMLPQANVTDGPHSNLFPTSDYFHDNLFSTSRPCSTILLDASGPCQTTLISEVSCYIDSCQVRSPAQLVEDANFNTPVSHTAPAATILHQSSSSAIADLVLYNAPRHSRSSLDPLGCATWEPLILVLAILSIGLNIYAIFCRNKLYSSFNRLPAYLKPDWQPPVSQLVLNALLANAREDGRLQGNRDAKDKAEGELARHERAALQDRKTLEKERDDALQKQDSALQETQRAVHAKSTAEDERDTAVQEIAVAVQEKEAYQKKTQAAISDKDAAVAKTNAALQERDTAVQDKKSAEEVTEVLRSEKDSAVQGQRAVEKHTTELQVDLDAKQQELDLEKESHSESKKALEQLCESDHHSKNREKVLQQRLDGVLAEVEELLPYKAEYETLRHELETKSEQLEQAKNDKDTVSHSLEQEQDAHSKDQQEALHTLEEEQARHEHIKTNFEDREMKLQQQLQKSSADIERLQSEKRQAEKEAKDKLTSVEVTIVELQQQIDSKTTECNEANDQVARLNEDVTRLEADVGQKNVELNTATLKITSLDRQVSDAEKEKMEADTECGKAIAEVTDLNKVMNELQNSETYMKEDNDMLNNKVTALEQDNSDLRQQISELQQEYTDSPNSQHTSHDDGRQDGDDVSPLAIGIDGLSPELQELSPDKDAEKNTLDYLQDATKSGEDTKSSTSQDDENTPYGPPSEDDDQLELLQGLAANEALKEKEDELSLSASSSPHQPGDTQYHVPGGWQFEIVSATIDTNDSLIPADSHTDEVSPPSIEEEVVTPPLPYQQSLALELNHNVFQEMTLEEEQAVDTADLTALEALVDEESSSDESTTSIEYVDTLEEYSGVLADPTPLNPQPATTEIEDQGESMLEIEVSPPVLQQGTPIRFVFGIETDPSFKLTRNGLGEDEDIPENIQDDRYNDWIADKGVEKDKESLKYLLNYPPGQALHGLVDIDAPDAKLELKPSEKLGLSQTKGFTVLPKHKLKYFNTPTEITRRMILLGLEIVDDESRSESTGDDALSGTSTGDTSSSSEIAPSASTDIAKSSGNSSDAPLGYSATNTFPKPTISPATTALEIIVSNDPPSLEQPADKAPSDSAPYAVTNGQDSPSSNEYTSSHGSATNTSTDFIPSPATMVPRILSRDDDTSSGGSASETSSDAGSSAAEDATGLVTDLKELKLAEPEASTDGTFQSKLPETSVSTDSTASVPDLAQVSTAAFITATVTTPDSPFDLSLALDQPSDSGSDPAPRPSYSEVAVTAKSPASEDTAVQLGCGQTQEQLKQGHGRSKHILHPGLRYDRRENMRPDDMTDEQCFENGKPLQESMHSTIRDAPHAPSVPWTSGRALAFGAEIEQKTVHDRQLQAKPSTAVKKNDLGLSRWANESLASVKENKVEQSEGAQEVSASPPVSLPSIELKQALDLVSQPLPTPTSPPEPKQDSKAKHGNMGNSIWATVSSNSEPTTGQASQPLSESQPQPAPESKTDEEHEDIAKSKTASTQSALPLITPSVDLPSSLPDVEAQSSPRTKSEAGQGGVADSMWATRDADPPQPTRSAPRLPSRPQPQSKPKPPTGPRASCVQKSTRPSPPSATAARPGAPSHPSQLPQSTPRGPSKPQPQPQQQPQSALKSNTNSTTTQAQSLAPGNASSLQWASDPSDRLKSKRSADTRGHSRGGRGGRGGKSRGN